MRAVKSRFEGGKVTLDGNEFIRCHFENVSLVFSGIAPVTLNKCEFENVRFEFDGPAALTMRFIAGLYHGMGDGGPPIVEQVFEQIRTAKPPVARQSEAPPASESQTATTP